MTKQRGYKTKPWKNHIQSMEENLPMPPFKKKKHEISFQRNKGQKAEYKGLAERYNGKKWILIISVM